MGPELYFVVHCSFGLWNVAISNVIFLGTRRISCEKCELPYPFAKGLDF